MHPPAHPWTRASYWAPMSYHRGPVGKPRQADALGVFGRSCTGTGAIAVMLRNGEARLTGPCQAPPPSTSQPWICRMKVATQTLGREGKSSELAEAWLADTSLLGVPLPLRKWQRVWFQPQTPRIVHLVTSCSPRCLRSSCKIFAEHAASALPSSARRATRLQSRSLDFPDANSCKHPMMCSPPMYETLPGSENWCRVRRLSRFGTPPLQPGAPVRAYGAGACRQPTGNPPVATSQTPRQDPGCVILSVELGCVEEL